LSGGQVAALIFAILLLLPGGCFLLAGISAVTDPQYAGIALLGLLIAAAILGLAGFLFWRAFRRRPADADGPSPPREP
jgi:membrane protein implicated in regulation of membrane protease activity